MKKFLSLIFTLTLSTSIMQAKTYSCQPVDLGLSVMWASYNIGSESAENPGSYFAWGTIKNAIDNPSEATNVTKPDVTETLPPITGIPADESMPDLAYDIATELLGNGWYTPTSDDWNELKNNCTMSVMTLDDNETTILRFTSRINGNHIDLCSTGYHTGDSIKWTTYSDKSDMNCYIYQTSDKLVYNPSFGIYSMNYVYYHPDYGFRIMESRYSFTPVRAVYRNPVIGQAVESITVSPTSLELKGKDGGVIVASSLPKNAETIGYTWSSSDESVATVDSRGLVSPVGNGSCNIIVTAADGSGVTATVPVTVSGLVDEQYVDLGLGVKWATTNLDAETPYDSGSYYCFGRIEPHSQSGWPFNQYWDIDLVTFPGNPEYDAATAKLGSGWSTPTKEMFEELIENCQMEWIEDKDGNGSWIYYNKFTSKINGNSIIIPCSGIESSDSFNTGTGTAYLLTSSYVPYTNEWDRFQTYMFKAQSTAKVYIVKNYDSEKYAPIRPVYNDNTTNSLTTPEVDHDGTFKAYDIEGRLVRDSMSYDDIRSSLEPGFYILVGSNGATTKIKI